MNITNLHNVSLSMAVWLANDTYDYNFNPNHISATGLLNSTRSIILGSRIPPAEQTIDIMDRVATSMGTALHDAIERAWLTAHRENLLKLGYKQGLVDRILVNPTPEELAAVKNPIAVYMEKRSAKKIGKHSVSGKFDFVGDGTLEDFKSTGTYGFMKDRSNEKFAKQGSIYKWLNPDIITSDYMLIQYIFTDWSKLRSMIEEKKGYPKFRLEKVQLPLMEPKETEAWIRSKLAEIVKYKDADDDKIPECNAEELWQDPSEFKYYKNPAKTKRSSGNFATYAEAHAKQLDNGGIGIIKEVKGTVKKCKYCDAAPICRQKNQYILDGTLVLDE